jgi:arylsulfatase A-like enzyme
VKSPVRLFLLLLAAVCALAFAGCAQAPGENRDNVVIVVIDTLRRDHLATYGYPRNTAPFLGELARGGASFKGLSPSSWTKPATASLLTGLHPVRHQAIDRWDRLPDEAVTLAQRFHRRGYGTLAASTNGWVSPVFGFDRGFDRFILDKNQDGKVLNRDLFPALDGLKPPFFLYVHYVDPHAPYAPETGWDGRPLPAALRAAGPVTVEELDGAHAYPRSPAFLARVRDLYDGEIRAADDDLRELVGQLERRGLMKSTVLVVTADHGEELGEHGRMSHGQTLYQEVLRVPLVIHAPHRFRGGLRFGRASLLDLAPTLAELFGWKREEGDPGFDGVSLLPVLTGRAPASSLESRAFLEHLDFTDGAALALVAGPRKIILEKDEKHLFDLAGDPGERRDLFGRPDTAGEIGRLSSELAGQYNAYSRSALARRSARYDPELEGKLISLGYVAGDQKVRRRAIPRRVDPPSPSSPASWNPLGPPSGCARVAEADSDRYLLQGWYEPELGGRWTERRASLLLKAGAPESSRLVVSGTNFRPTPVELRVSVGHRLALETRLALGGFAIPVDLPGGFPGGDTALVEIETGSTFVPFKEGEGDHRKLGIFLSSVCFESRGGSAPRTAP